MKQFQTPLTNGDRREPERVEFELDGQVLAYIKPKRATVIGVFMSATESGSAALRADYDFIQAVLEPESHEYLMGRLRDAEDPLDHETIAEIARWIVKEVLRNPTNGSVASPLGARVNGTGSTVAPPPAASTPGI